MQRPRSASRGDIHHDMTTAVLNAATPEVLGNTISHSLSQNALGPGEGECYACVCSMYSFHHCMSVRVVYCMLMNTHMISYHSFIFMSRFPNQ